MRHSAKVVTSTAFSFAPKSCSCCNILSSHITIFSGKDQAFLSSILVVTNLFINNPKERLPHLINVVVSQQQFNINPDFPSRWPSFRLLSTINTPQRTKTHLFPIHQPLDIYFQKATFP